MTAIKSHHSRQFEHLIAERRLSVLDALAAGVNKKTYWRLVGQLMGLDDALQISEKADFNLSGDEPE